MKLSSENKVKEAKVQQEENVTEEAEHVETKEEAVKRVAEPLSVTIEKAKKDINTAVIMAERNYGLHSSITVLILESVLANVRAGNATVAAMEFEQYKGELLKNNNAAWFVLYVFGLAGSGANAGLPYVLANNGSGVARWDLGGVLLKKRQ